MADYLNVNLEVISFNRTIVELKFVPVYNLASVQLRFNRTIVELKSVTHFIRNGFAFLF